MENILPRREARENAFLLAFSQTFGDVRLPRVSLTVLRLALAEMLYGDEKKVGVVINEAVELTKKYGADEDYQFVNGLLGTVAREQGLDTAEDAASEEP